MSLAESLRLLEEAMRPPVSGSDPERRRAAARLSELARADDEELGRFAKRHLGGRPVDPESLKDLRELVLGVARLVSLHGTAESASSMVTTLRSTLLPRLEQLEAESAAARARVEELARSAEREAARVASTTPDAGDGSVLHVNAMLGFVAPEPPRAEPPPPPPPPQSPEPPPSTPPPAPSTVRMPRDTTADGIPAPKSRPTLPFGIPAARPHATEADPPIARNTVLTHTGANQASAFVERPGLTRPGPSDTAEDDLHVPTTVTGTDIVPERSALPFTRTAAPPSQRAELPPHLTHIGIDAHAAFFALLEVYPDREADVFARYGLRGRADREALDRHWFTKLKEDPRLSEEWVALRDHAIAHYKNSR